MDFVIIISAVILAIIAVTEIVCLFTPLSKDKAYIKILPVFCEDTDFQQRLEKLALKSGGRCSIAIINYSATEKQLQLCRQFCGNNPDTVIIPHEEFEKYLLETFAITEKV